MTLCGRRPVADQPLPGLETGLSVNTLLSRKRYAVRRLRERHGFYRSNIRRRMAERREAMTPAERERFRQGALGRCGFGPSTGESQGQ